MEASAGNGITPMDFVKQQCAEVIGRHVPPLEKPQDVVLYGFGRIGRLLARLLIEKTGSGQQLRLRAIVVRKASNDDLVKRASLLRRDSVHGSFKGTIRVDDENNCIIANGNVIRVIYASNPAEVDYESYGITDAIVIDNTGAWRDQKGSRRTPEVERCGARDRDGARRRAGIKNIVSGINSNGLSKDDRILGAASCTTNAIVPILKAINDEFEIQSGHIETVHAYTPDQNLTDNYHKKSRRGRSAPLNLVITETGASSAITDLLPSLDGKLTGNAIRVPTPDVSLAILNLTVSRKTTLEEVNGYLRDASLYSPLQRQIDFIKSPEVVSSDFVGNRHACIVDGCATIVKDNRVVVVRLVRQRIRLFVSGRARRAEVGRHSLSADSERRRGNRFRLSLYEVVGDSDAEAARVHAAAGHQQLCARCGRQIVEHRRGRRARQHSHERVLRCRTEAIRLRRRRIAIAFDGRGQMILFGAHRDPLRQLLEHAAIRDRVNWPAEPSRSGAAWAGCRTARRRSR